MTTAILCKKSYTSAKLLSEATSIDRIFYAGTTGRPSNPTPDVLINWGLYGEDLRKVFRKYRTLSENSVILNKKYPGNKFDAIVTAHNAGVPVPDTQRQLDFFESGWISKPFNSGGGRNIFRIDSPANMSIHQMRATGTSSYVQREVPNRKYEVRCTAFKWMPHEKWGMWKKLCSDREQLCWNHEQGGVFEKVDPPHNYPLFDRIKEHCRKLLDAFGIEFGAFDFIVGEDWNEMFLEVNMRPGFTDYGIEPYADAFNTLKGMGRMAVVSMMGVPATEDQRQQFPQVREEDTVGYQRQADAPAPNNSNPFEGMFRPRDIVSDLEEPLIQMLSAWKGAYRNTTISVDDAVSHFLSYLRQEV